jgi:DNA repair protein RecN (Recombination protein N)
VLYEISGFRPSGKMIRHLSIRNYILIDQLELDFKVGLNIVTGETGAGKSILMGALDLISGERADPKSLRNLDEKCVIEAWFSGEKQNLQEVLTSLEIDNEAETIIRREILPGGKSRAFVNDTPVNLETLRKIGNLLLDIHGQHDTILLGNADRQLEILDVLADTKSVKDKYVLAYKTWKKANSDLNYLIEKREKDNAELGFKQFVFDELEKANIKEGEQQVLEKEADMLRNAESIKLKLHQAIELMEGQTDIASNLKAVSAQLEKLGSFSTSLGTLAERAKSAYLEVKDILEELKESEVEIVHNPERQIQTEERLSIIYSLQKKHRKETDYELIALATQLSSELENFSQLDEEIEKAGKIFALSELQLIESGNALSQMRQAKTPTISQNLIDLLKEMGMPNSRFEIFIGPCPASQTGMDKVNFLFSANPGQTLAELKNAASGGEFSRLMLAIKCLLAGNQAMPTLIFDEIDTGISGEVALKVGKIIKNLATRHQVFAITHSAQMASQADAHWFVYKNQTKENTQTGVRQLTQDESLEEIAKMISGLNVSEASLKAAKELVGA